MFVRIVKMTFKKEKVTQFEQLFNENKHKIRGFEGCTFLELYQDKKDTRIFFTYSYWENESSLEEYRHSQLFKGVWSQTKVLFDEKPEAWSVDKVVSLD
ncbi:putative quinol monooxygenase [Maribacter sp. 2210JD10-5]|uniref:putative quinol monooxygenase n=1 Tax=Maribacter sp. 2210JD10-5 TaxID=3386272 RepID=UPI0039BC8F65